MGFEPMNVALRGLCVNHFTNGPLINLLVNSNIIYIILQLFLNNNYIFGNTNYREGEYMIIIVGSRRNGNSLKLANLVKEELDKSRIACSIIVPGNQKIHICTGCMDCDKDGKCDFTDDMENNINLIKNDDYIMFITPTRWNLLSGDLKIFMDRLNPMYSRKQLKDKKMIAVSVGAKDDSLYSTEAALSDLNSFAESAGMKVVLEKKFSNCLKDSDILSHEYDLNKFISDIKKMLSN